jgi:hypothetical protein
MKLTREAGTLLGKCRCVNAAGAFGSVSTLWLSPQADVPSATATARAMPPASFIR